MSTQVRDAARLPCVQRGVRVGAPGAADVGGGDTLGAVGGRTGRLQHGGHRTIGSGGARAVRRHPMLSMGAMCRNIKLLFNFDPPATDDEVRAAAVQFVRKVSGFTRPSQANQAAFDWGGRRGGAVGAHAARRAGHQRAEPQPRRGSPPRQGAGGEALRRAGGASGLRD